MLQLLLDWLNKIFTCYRLFQWLFDFSPERKKLKSGKKNFWFITLWRNKYWIRLYIYIEIWNKYLLLKKLKYFKILITPRIFYWLNFYLRLYKKGIYEKWYNLFNFFYIFERRVIFNYFKSWLFQHMTQPKKEKYIFIQFPHMIQ